MALSDHLFYDYETACERLRLALPQGGNRLKLDRYTDLVHWPERFCTYLLFNGEPFMRHQSGAMILMTTGNHPADAYGMLISRFNMFGTWCHINIARMDDETKELWRLHRYGGVRNWRKRPHYWMNWEYSYGLPPKKALLITPTDFNYVPPHAERFLIRAGDITFREAGANEMEIIV